MKYAGPTVFLLPLIFILQTLPILWRILPTFWTGTVDRVYLSETPIPTSRWAGHSGALCGKNSSVSANARAGATPTIRGRILTCRTKACSFVCPSEASSLRPPLTCQCLSRTWVCPRPYASSTRVLITITDLGRGAVEAFNGEKGGGLDGKLVAAQLLAHFDSTSSECRLAGVNIEGANSFFFCFVLCSLFLYRPAHALTHSLLTCSQNGRV